MPAFTSADPNAYLAVGLQSGLGSPQLTPAKFRFAKYSAGNSFRPALTVQDMREGGDGLDWGVSYKQQQSVQGQLVCYPRPDFLGQMLAIMLGGATWAGASAPAVHSFHSGHASFPYATIQAAHPGTDLLHLMSDVRFTGFTLEGVTGQPWKLTAPFVGVKYGASSAIALVPSYATGEDFWLFHGAPSYLLDGTADSTIDSITISANYGAENLQAQSVQLDDIVLQNRDINVSMTRRYQDATLFKKIYFGGGVQPTVSIATGALAVNLAYGAAASLKALNINLGLLTYREDAITELNPDGQTIKETVSAKALKVGTAAMAVSLTNAHASAYGS
jgi:hypothetical protein